MGECELKLGGIRERKRERRERRGGWRGGWEDRGGYQEVLFFFHLCGI